MARTEGSLEEVAGLSREELAEALVEARKREEEAKLAERAFLFAVSHELKTPLNAILGFTDAMKMGLSGPLTDMQRRQLASIDRSARRLFDLINDVLDLTRALSGEVVVTVEEFDLGVALSKVAEEFRVEVEGRGLAYTVDHREGIPVIGDHHRFQQVIRQLLSNAIKFTERGSIEVRVEEEGEGMAGRTVRASVTDTGIGIAPSDLEAIWKPFRQLDSGRARRYEGAGIGLTLARLLMEAMGGTIRVESKPGAGSRFIAELSRPSGGAASDIA